MIQSVSVLDLQKNIIYCFSFLSFDLKLLLGLGCTIYTLRVFTVHIEYLIIRRCLQDLAFGPLHSLDLRLTMTQSGL